MNGKLSSTHVRLGLLLVAVFSLSACPGPDDCGGIAPSSRNVSVNPADLTLEVGGESSVSAAVGGGCVNGKTGVRFESSNTAIATVTSSGAVTAVGPGSANIIATSTDFGVTGSVRVTVRSPAIQSLVLSATALSLRERKTAVLRVTVEATGRLTKRVQFTSSAPTIATVTEIDSLSATITAVAAGTADIEVVSVGDATKRGTARLTVDPALVAMIAITGVAASDSIVLASARQLGTTVSDSSGITLTNRTIAWTSLNPAVLTVSPTGELRAMSAGTTNITAAVAIGDGSGNRTASATMKVFGSLQIAVAPRTPTVDEGQTITLTATVTGTAGIARGVAWESSDIGRATVSSAGVVTGVLAGGAPVVVRARSLAVPSVLDSSLITVQPRSVPTTIDARPNVDTLSPLATRQFTATVRDQRGAVVSGAPIVWRSLNAFASVSAGGVVTAVSAGDARIVASTPRVGADSLRDTSAVLIVPPCSLVRAIQFGSTYNGSLGAFSCIGRGYPIRDNFSLTSAVQQSYAIRLTPTFVASLVQLSIGNGLYGMPPSDSSVVGFAVMRAGTFGFTVAAPSANTFGNYTFTVTSDPDPAQFCVFTDVTRGVSFDTALIPVTCQSRDIRILPALDPGASISISAAAQNFPVQIELREDQTNALLGESRAAATGATASILFGNPTFRFVYVRVLGTNGTVRVTIN